MKKVREPCVRVNISIPRRLRDEMAALLRHANWSALATGAFESAVAEAKMRAAGESTMEAFRTLAAARRGQA